MKWVDLVKQARSGAGIDVLSLIRKRLPSFSKSERAVANYLLGQPQSVSVLSISDLALSVGVSEATVVRFAKKLDFNGFIEFKRALFEDMLTFHQEEVLPEYEEVDITDDPTAVMTKLFGLHKRTIDYTASLIDSNHFTRAAMAIANATNVNFYGHGGSGYIAQSALFQFLKTGIRCSAWVDETTQERSVRILEKTDVVVVLSHSGETAGIVQSAQMARARGITVISITNDPESSLAKTSDIILLTNVGKTAMGAEAGASRIAQFAILDALIVSVALIRRQTEQLF